ncbi:hypothetical protein VC88_01685 [Geobacillus sp. A8]|nr:hypothetical protein VC88_01685 [Geobacillus sp. A8]
MVGYTLTVNDVPSSTSIFEDAGCVGTTRSKLGDAKLVALPTERMAHELDNTLSFISLYLPLPLPADSKMPSASRQLEANSKM